MNAKHTPGPWKIRNLQSEGNDIGFTDDLQIATVPDSDGFGVPVAMVCYNGKERREANARLIAASPDLLAALEVIIKMIGPYAGQGRMDAEISNARAAIAKAKGE